MNKILKKINNWVNFDQPNVGSADDWEEWEAAYKKSAPIRYAVFREAPRKLFWPVKHRFEGMLDTIRYSVTKPQILDTGLKPDYYDKETLLLHVSFNLLKDFVEVEKASLHTYCHSEAERPFIKRIPYLKYFYKVRNAEYGLDYLNWEATLDDPNSPNFNGTAKSCGTANQNGMMSQAEAAREILYLYKWWTEERPTRVELEYICTDPMDNGNHPLFRLTQKYQNDNPEEVLRFREFCQMKEEQETAWRDEDTKNLCRLARIRHHMWT